MPMMVNSLNGLAVIKSITKDRVVIVSGEAMGADSLAIQLAKSHNVALHVYPAHWDLHGNAAGPIRNELMAGNADGLLAFWDGKSKGTRHMIHIAKHRGLDVHIVGYNGYVPEENGECQPDQKKNSLED